jgi:hypothetical protein
VGVLRQGLSSTVLFFEGILDVRKAGGRNIPSRKPGTCVADLVVCRKANRLPCKGKHL